MPAIVMLDLYATGFAIGFSVAATVGPISLLCIRRTLEEGRGVGFVSGLGAATADAVYAGVAVLGLSTLTRLVAAERRPLGIIGGLCLVLLAVASMRRNPVESAGLRGARGRSACYLTTLGLTLANPVTILTLGAALAGLGLSRNRLPEATVLAFTVFCGAAAWWAILTAVLGFFRARLEPRAIRRLSAASSVLLGAVGCVAIATSLGPS
jgi:threonine/homoserine/homoserine lactone efflux protein